MFLEEQEVGQHKAVLGEEPGGGALVNLVPRAPLLILRLASRMLGVGQGTLIHLPELL